jgi:hypothetical protein
MQDLYPFCTQYSTLFSCHITKLSLAWEQCYWYSFGDFTCSVWPIQDPSVTTKFVQSCSLCLIPMSFFHYQHCFKYYARKKKCIHLVYICTLHVCNQCLWFRSAHRLCVDGGNTKGDSWNGEEEMGELSSNPGIP